MTEFNYFKSAECNRLFSIWISNYPESFHHSDMNRFTNMVICILDNDECLEYAHIQQSTQKLKEWMIESYISNYGAMRDMYAILRDRWSVE